MEIVTTLQTEFCDGLEIHGHPDFAARFAKRALTYEGGSGAMQQMKNELTRESSSRAPDTQQ